MASSFKLKNESGFSLIELVVVLIILGTISAIAYGVVLLNAQTFGTLSQEISDQWIIRKAMNVMRKDFAELDPKEITNIKAKPIQRLYFRDQAGILIRYMYNNSHKLRRKKGSGSWSVLVENLTDRPFQFLDADMNATTDPNKLTYIKVNINANFNGKIKTAEDIFFLRNSLISDPSP